MGTYKTKKFMSECMFVHVCVCRHEYMEQGVCVIIVSFFDIRFNKLNGGIMRNNIAMKQSGLVSWVSELEARNSLLLKCICDYPEHKGKRKAAIDDNSYPENKWIASFKQDFNKCSSGEWMCEL